MPIPNKQVAFDLLTAIHNALENSNISLSWEENILENESSKCIAVRLTDEDGSVVNTTIDITVENLKPYCELSLEEFSKVINNSVVYNESTLNNSDWCLCSTVIVKVRGY